MIRETEKSHKSCAGSISDVANKMLTRKKHSPQCFTVAANKLFGCIFETITFNFTGNLESYTQVTRGVFKNDSK